MGFTVLIDESGDTGISKLRSEARGGSSPFFVMGAIVFNRSTEMLARKKLNELQTLFGKKKLWKHAADLNHAQKVKFSKEIAAMKCRTYGLISYKPTLADYASEIDWDPHKFYNKCIKYLLEIIFRDLSEFQPTWDGQRIVVEQRNHDYDALRRYLSKVKDNPIYPQSKVLTHLNPFSITQKDKSEEDLLRFADFVSNALYSCVNLTPDNFSIPEPRYLKEISGRFGASASGEVLGTGIKCIHRLEDMKIKSEIREILLGLRAMPPRKRS